VNALDRTLELLRAAGLPYRWHETQLSRWDSCCPRCLSGTWDLTIVDRGQTVALRCQGGCTEQQIVEALQERPALLEALELAEAASELAHRALKLAEEAAR
jgi:hypothetical protein